MQEVGGVQSPSRKRKHASEDGSNSRKALRLREELAGSDEETSALNDNDDEHTTQRSGPFAHIKSAKKRHKLEREARKAKKQVERGETVDIPAAVLQNGTTAQLEEDAGIVKKTKRQKEKAVAVVEEEEDDREQRRLEKHASVLKKFDKVQKKAKVSKDKQEEGPVEVPESTRTIVDPLEPIHIDTTVPTPEITYSALPSWVTAAQRITNTSTKSFASMGLQRNVVKRLHQLDFASAMPVQQAIVPILLPPGVPGSVFPTGTDRIVPDLAVAAPTGSGKTLGYLLPIVEALGRDHSSEHSLRALVVVPTRELVAQVAQLAEGLSKGGRLSIGTATATTSLRDEQQRLVNIKYVHKAQEYARLSKLANTLANPPEEDAERFDDYLAAVDALDGDTQRLIDSLVDCPPDFLPEHQSTIDILVCTPGRLIEHLDNTIGFNLASLTHLVLDEADKLLDEQYDGFLERLHGEFSLPHTAEKQGSREVELRRLGLWEEQRERRVRKVVLSATMTQDIAQLQALKLHRPQLIIVGAQQGDQAENDTGTQNFELPPLLQEFCVPADDGSAKPLYLLKLLSAEILAEKLNLKQTDSDDSDDTSDSISDDESSVSSDTSHSDSASDSSTSSSASSAPSISAKLETSNVPTVLIFTASNEAALRLTYLLKRLRPRQASQVTCLTKVNSAPKIAVSSSPIQSSIVIATDRAGRGLDTISGRAITHVVQYDVPRSVVSYVHRVGRTARAGRGGQAWTLYTNAEARWFLKEVTRAETIVRSREVQKVKLQAEDEQLQQAYEEALAGMKDIVQNRGRGS